MLNNLIPLYTLPTLLLLFLLTPFSLFTYIALVGRLIGSRNLFLFVLVNLFIEWILFFLLFDSVILTGNTIEFSLYSWIDLYEGLEINFILDTLGIEMGFVILLISTCVILYSFDYLSADPHLVRFVCYLHLFLFFMLVIVTSGNLLQFFIGWVCVGIVSSFLINFWIEEGLETNQSATKAVIFNKVGDIGYLVATILIFLRVGLRNFTAINGFNWLEPSLITADMVVFFLFIGAMGKSAQLGLHAWLPDAMEGPTPVSALLHFATMVAVCIFFIIKLLILSIIWIKTIIAGFPFFLFDTTFVDVNDFDASRAPCWRTFIQKLFLSKDDFEFDYDILNDEAEVPFGTRVSPDDVVTQFYALPKKLAEAYPWLVVEYDAEIRRQKSPNAYLIYQRDLHNDLSNAIGCLAPGRCFKYQFEAIELGDEHYIDYIIRLVPHLFTNVLYLRAKAQMRIVFFLLHIRPYE